MEQLDTTVGAVITGLTNNPAFPAPTVDLKAVQAVADALNAALASQAHGGTPATAERRPMVPDTEVVEMMPASR